MTNSCFTASISDDGVLSHREFIVVIKNQLVRGLENVSQLPDSTFGLRKCRLRLESV